MEFVVARDASGLWTWQLKDRFGQVLAVAPKSYLSKVECLLRVTSAKAALSAPVREVDQTEALTPPQVDPKLG